MAVPRLARLSKATASMACIPACMHMNQRRFVLLVGGTAWSCWRWPSGTLQAEVPSLASAVGPMSCQTHCLCAEGD